MSKVIDIFILALVLLVFLLLFVPKIDYVAVEGFRTTPQSEALSTNRPSNVNQAPVANVPDMSSLYRRMFSTNLKNKSTLMYSDRNNNDDATYFDAYNKLRTYSDEPLIMNRCVEFKKGGIDSVLNMMRATSSFFISQKIFLQYTSFGEINTKIIDTIKDLHSKSKSPHFYGPVYVLLTQYPLLRKVRTASAGCTVSTIPLPFLNHENNGDVFMPLLIENNGGTGCVSQVSELEKHRLVCEIHLLFPAHAKGQNIETIGDYVYTKWEEIKKNMTPFFETGGDPDVINTRSKDTQCFTKCGTTTEDGYSCGARNSTPESPYESVVLNTVENNNVFTKLRDFATLYVVNTIVYNNLLGKEIFREGVAIQPLQTTSAKPIRETVYNRLLNLMDTKIINKGNDRDAWDRGIPIINDLTVTIKMSKENMITVEAESKDLMNIIKACHETASFTTSITIANAKLKEATDAQVILNEKLAFIVSEGATVQPNLDLLTIEANKIEGAKFIMEAMTHLPAVKTVLTNTANYNNDAAGYISAITKFRDDLQTIIDKERESLESLNQLKHLRSNSYNSKISFINNKLEKITNSRTSKQEVDSAVTATETNITSLKDIVEQALTHKDATERSGAISKTVAAQGYAKEAANIYNNMNKTYTDTDTAYANAKTRLEMIEREKVSKDNSDNAKNEFNKIGGYLTAVKSAEQKAFAARPRSEAENEVGKAEAILIDAMVTKNKIEEYATESEKAAFNQQSSSYAQSAREYANLASTIISQITQSIETAKGHRDKNIRTLVDGVQCWKNGIQDDCNKCINGQSSGTYNDMNIQFCGPIPSNGLCGIPGIQGCDVSYNNNCLKNCSVPANSVNDLHDFSGQCTARCR